MARHTDTEVKVSEIVAGHTDTEVKKVAVQTRR